MNLRRLIDSVTARQWLIECAFWAIVLLAFSGGYRIGKAVVHVPDGTAQRG